MIPTCPTTVPMNMSIASDTNFSTEIKDEHSMDAHVSPSSTATISPQSTTKPLATPCEKVEAGPMSRLENAILRLPPSFYSLNMGTGITSILLYNLPYNATWLQRIGLVIFVLNIAIFTVLTLGNIIRYIRWEGLFVDVRNHLASGLFWGCLPMGFATIVVSWQLYPEVSRTR